MKAVPEMSVGGDSGAVYSYKNHIKISCEFLNVGSGVETSYTYENK